MGNIEKYILSGMKRLEYRNIDYQFSAFLVKSIFPAKKKKKKFHYKHISGRSFTVKSLRDLIGKDWNAQ